MLLDTHVLIWAVSNPERLKPAARLAISDPATEIFVSTATVWELAIKCARGQLIFPLSEVDDLLAGMAIEPLPISVAHAVAAGGLPRHHADPFDRMLVAQARLEQLVLVTEDAALTRYDVAILDRGGSATS